MGIHVYGKTSEDINSFDSVINAVRKNEQEITITVENKRSFRELEVIKEKCRDDIFLMGSLSSLGTNAPDILDQLKWFIENEVLLVICDVPSTYEFGVDQPMNKAILSTIYQSVLSTGNAIIPMRKKASVGRTRMSFPDDWDELYEQWENGQITSKDFIAASGLKKATFYNMMTEYKEIQKLNQDFLSKFKRA